MFFRLYMYSSQVFTLLRAFLYAYGGICAAKVLHKKLLLSILKAPVAFFDVTPVSRQNMHVHVTCPCMCTYLYISTLYECISMYSCIMAFGQMRLFPSTGIIAVYIHLLCTDWQNYQSIFI